MHSGCRATAASSRTTPRACPCLPCRPARARLAPSASPLRSRRQLCRSIASASLMYSSYLETSGVQLWLWNGFLMSFLTLSAYYLSGVKVEEPEGKSECPRCHGTGYEACFCSRWSDGDVGCPSCNYTGHMRCRACGGGGTAVPIRVAVRKDGC